ncbi:hypothetical protein V8E54_012758 [Elaphomyces granulatus]
MVNPPQSPRTPSALRQVINVFDDDAPVSPDVTDNSPDSPSHGRERPELPLPTNVTLRKAREDGVKRQAPKERTYKQLDWVWYKTQNKGSPWYQDRLWSCKYCTYTSTDSGRHGNTKTSRKEHGFTKDMHLRGDKIEVKRDEAGTIEAFLRQAVPELSPEEAFLRFFIRTNQPFSMCDNPAFQGIYKSLGKACPFVSDDTFRRFAEQRFNQVRSDQALDLHIHINCFRRTGLKKPQAHHWWNWVLDWTRLGTTLDEC